MRSRLNPYLPSNVDEQVRELPADYSKLRRVVAGLSVLHTLWLGCVVFSIGPRLVERNAIMLMWEVFAIAFGVVLALRLRPVFVWRIAFAFWIVSAMVLPVAVLPSSASGVWRPYMVLAVLLDWFRVIRCQP